MRLLVWLMGGKYTSQLTNINTFLVCRQASNKPSSSTTTSEAINGDSVATTTTTSNATNQNREHHQLQSQKLQKAKKWKVNVVNGVWLSELYLGNTFALAQPLSDRYTALDVENHFYYDPLLAREFMDQWKQLISLPVEAIRQAKMASPLKQANRSLQQFAVPRFTRPLSPSPSGYDRQAKLPRM